ncbi:MAG: aminotransferase class I/II-fold pyridoxal phosphate-dependent enzyme [Mesorhizobium sp.]|nr:MAG: aminotransferase class I/II-fold pyridoxal phosphate-dependent enzyme [Mesorhizobium sp.]
MKLLSGAIAAVDHGGSLGRASALFPHAPQPFVDLSTGINPHSYPLFELPATALTRLPEAAQLRELAEIAAAAYGAPSAAHVAAAPGTQILLPRVASLLRPGKALVLGPTYAEHARAAAIAGHAVAEVGDFDELADADLAVLVNPNNPDGRVIEKARLLELAAWLRAKDGLLVVDEAFMDAGPIEHSLAGDVVEGGIVVLRSFGKFFGLAGVRLGFALADQLTTAISYPTARGCHIRAPDPQPPRGPAARPAARLDALLGRFDVPVVRGTSLFRYLSFAEAPSLFSALGEDGVLVRHFAERPGVLRIGLPGSEPEWQRLESALAAWAARRKDASKEIGR